MRNSASRLAVAAVGIWLSLSGVASAQRPKDRYDAALAREEQVRSVFDRADGARASPDVLEHATQVASAYEMLVRRYPTSGYADNALWQGAALAEAAYDKFARAADRDRAVRLYQWLVQEYPTSPLVKRAQMRAAKLADARPTAPPVPAERATLTGIQRTVLPDTVRVTLELDREVAYHEERLAGPPRLFFDLKAVQATPALADTVLSYAGDVVSKIRVGRHPDSTVRVVLDFHDVSRYSVFTLYSPFRLVIDCERSVTRTAAQPSVVAPAATDSAPLAVAVSPGELPRIVVPPAMPAMRAAPPAASGPGSPERSTTAPAPNSAAPIAPPTANAAGGFSIARQLGLGVSRIVIDPGHGGHDTGAQGKGLNEADLVLDVALRLEKLLQDEPRIEVTLTRRTNVYIPLEDRTAMANRQNADLFLSIHANASRNAAARGVETYFLSFASSPDAELVAARENSASEREMHNLPDIIKAIALNNKLDESRDLAGMIQESLVTRLRKSNRDIRNLGVKKAPFVVLIGASMPSVLAEIAFVTNKQELQLLKSANYKQKIADALEAAVLRYRRSLKSSTAVASQ